MQKAFTRAGLACLAIALSPAAALAHSGEGTAASFVSGALHPLLGLDHLVAMVAVGLWGAQLGRPLVLALPVAFPLMMAIGGAAGLFGLPMVAVEFGIALSALALGLAILAAFRAPVWLAVAVVAGFAIFHGYAHGQELPESGAPLPYVIGFVLMTGILHLVGIAIGLLNDRGREGPLIVRAGGGVIAALGLWFVAGAAGAV